jgi:hypothetical protein
MRADRETRIRRILEEKGFAALASLSARCLSLRFLCLEFRHEF